MSNQRSEYSIDPIVKLTEAIGTLKESQARIEAAVNEAARRMEQTDKVVNGHAAALQDGIRKEIRDLAGQMAGLVKQHLDEKIALNGKRADKERRHFDLRQAILIGVIMTVISGVFGVAFAAAQRRVEQKLQPPVLRIETR